MILEPECLAWSSDPPPKSFVPQFPYLKKYVDNNTSLTWSLKSYCLWSPLTLPGTQGLLLRIKCSNYWYFIGLPLTILISKWDTGEYWPPYISGQRENVNNGRRDCQIKDLWGSLRPFRLMEIQCLNIFLVPGRHFIFFTKKFSSSWILDFYINQIFPLITVQGNGAQHLV
jgi:hypothetical protein